MIRVRSEESRVRGCLLGGAVGDALGAPVEFCNVTEIVARHGEGGIRDYVEAFGRIGAITDDTQMTLFTAEGLIRAMVRYQARGICHPPAVVHHAYLRWAVTQGLTPNARIDSDGWLIGVRALWSRRVPGTTCLMALQDATAFGAPAVNDSKGCGAPMRIAPVGLAVDRTRVFEFAAEIAALTHGHPTAALASGFLATLIGDLHRGQPIDLAIDEATRRLVLEPEHAETLRAIERARSLAAGGRPDRATVESLGGGWVAEEAVAIALYGVLATRNFEEAVILAVNHSGDSDSTGAIAGNIAGTLYGAGAIPDRWLAPVELRAEIETIARDLWAARPGSADLSSPAFVDRYPGW